MESTQIVIVFVCNHIDCVDEANVNVERRKKSDFMSSSKSVKIVVFGSFSGPPRNRPRGGPKRAVFRDFGHFGQNYDRAHMERFFEKTPILGFDGTPPVRTEKRGVFGGFLGFLAVFEGSQRGPKNSSKNDHFWPFLRLCKNTFFRVYNVNKRC